MKTFADAEIRLAQTLPGYESRVPQQTLARAVEEVFANGENFIEDHPALAVSPSRTHLFGQAGCGTGKSLGYLIPAILSNKRVIISVTTKALQDQLANKDLPFLEEHLGITFSWTVLKGRANYFCGSKANDADESEVPRLSEMVRLASVPGFGGTRADFPFEVPDREWSQVASESDDCAAYDCKESGICHAEIARARAKECRLVVVNHALFFTDLIVKSRSEESVGMLDEYDLVIFDEAHEAAEVAGNVIGGQFSEGTLRALTGQIRSWAAKFSVEGEEHFSGSIAALLSSASDLFAALPVPQGKTTARLREEQLDGVAEQLGAVHDALKAIAGDLSSSKISPDVDGDRARQRRDKVRRMGNSTYKRLIEIITADFASVVRWVEVERKNVRGTWETRKVIKVAPVEVGPLLHEMLFSKTPAIMVSATMAVKGEFTFIAERLGVAPGTYSGLDVGSPFDFASQTRLYVPITLPEPKGQDVAVWEQQANQEILDLVKITRGRALVLFTSVKHMKAAYTAVGRMLPYTVKMQGQESVKDLAAWFATDTHGVLFGTKSFFTGFDIQGESLVNVIVAKLPFAVPDEPLTEARMDAIEARGGNSFSEYTIPVMSLVLQQAVGRLIRHTSDKGIVSVLDPRMLTKGYGKAILRDLPPMPVVKSLDEVRDFAAEVDLHFGTEPEPATTAALAF